ncbi:hypothetical protein ACQY0O_000897 [Thecaphora frezii]
MQSHTTTTAPSHSLSHSLSVSASDLKGPSSSISSTSESHSLSRTRQARSHYARAARAFLHKHHIDALLDSQHALDILAPSPDLGLSLSASNLAEADAELARLSEKLAILRFTLVSSTFADQQLRKSLLAQLSHNLNSDARPTAESEADTAAPTSRTYASKQLSSLLSREPPKLMAYLWFEALRLCSQTSIDTDVPSLEPSAETLLLAVELPASVVSAAILAALRLNDFDTRQSLGTQSARLIAEWYLAAYSSAAGPQGPSEKAATAYKRVVNLYALHILATRLDEWEYAREFVGYSSLEEPKKLALLGELDAAHAHLLSRPDRVFEAEAAAQKAYEAEKARRAAVEKEAQAQSSNGGKAHDIVNGVSDFLRGGGEKASKAADDSSKKRTGLRSRPANGNASSGSDSGSTRNGRSEGYFSPRGSSSSSSLQSLDRSPGSSSRSARSEESSRQGRGAAADHTNGGSSRSRAGHRSGSRSSNGTDGEASDAASNSGRSSSGKGAAANGNWHGHGHGAEKGKTTDPDDATYASTRAHLSRYIENSNGSRPRSGGAPSAGGSSVSASGNLLAALKNLFDLRNAQSRSYLLSAIVALFLFYRFIRRPLRGAALNGGGGGASAAAGRRKESAAARDARNKLVQRSGGSALSFGMAPLMVAWRKVVDTVKMGTQVTYL